MGIGAATASSVRLYRDNAIATIDAVLKTVRVYPGDDVYVGFSALDVDNNRFITQGETSCILVSDQINTILDSNRILFNSSLF